MKLHFLGGASTVTGAKYLLETKAGSKKLVKILIDCGMVRGAKEAEEENYKDFSFNPSEIDYLFITHAHIDHIGLIPKLYKDGFRGKIFTTAPTIDLARLTLIDSCEILQREAKEAGREPLYNEEHIKESLALAKAVEYNKKTKLINEIYFRFQNAGHILGSAIIEIWAQGKKIVFSGDLGNTPNPLLNPPAEIIEADYIVIESTYGNKIHENKEKRKEILENIIEDTIANRGVLMVPAFAVERSQELLYELNELVENSRIPRVPVFIDSPMAIEVTQVYKKYSDYFNKEARHLIKSGDELFKFPGLTLSETIEQSKVINRIVPPKIIIAGSGMSTGGRILFHEKMYLPDSRSCLLIISFQVKGSLGREILEGAKKVIILGEEISIRAKIVSISGYSSHADQENLYQWLTGFSKPVRNIFVVHGEKEASEALIQRIKDHLGIPASIPKQKDVVEL